MFDKQAYFKYSKALETFAMIKFVVLMLLYIVTGYLIGIYIIKNTAIGIICGIIVGIIMQYATYLKEQIKVEQMRMMLEIHNSITKKENL